MPPSTISRTSGIAVSSETAGRKLVATVSGATSSSWRTTASALVESSSITDMPGSTMARARRASACFCACAVLRR